MGKLIKTKALAKGFTLIEVLIALMIVSVALPALMLRVQSVSDNTAYMEEKTFAYWVAQNKMQVAGRFTVYRRRKVVSHRSACGCTER